MMSYSFTDEETEDFLGRTMMVPFVDLLNHSSYHHVELTYHPSCLKLIAIRNIGKVCWKSLNFTLIITDVNRVKR